MMQNKKIKHFLFFTILLMSTTLIRANQVVDISLDQASKILLEVESKPMLFADNTSVVEPKFKKTKAVLLAIFLGHFGVHRIYLGTKPNVPVVYSLTLGGGLGLLPLLDIIAILGSDDLSEFSDNDKVFMWSN